jgi:hypothetical protein
LKRQTYFKQVELEREQCESKAGLHNNSPFAASQTITPSMKEKSILAHNNGNAGFYQGKQGDNINTYRVWFLSYNI